jgi:hypothetical protein
VTRAVTRVTREVREVRGQVGGGQTGPDLAWPRVATVVTNKKGKFHQPKMVIFDGLIEENGDLKIQKLGFQILTTEKLEFHRPNVGFHNHWPNGFDGTSPAKK